MSLRKISLHNKLLCFQQSREFRRVARMAHMALLAPKRAQEERNALSALFTWYAPLIVLPLSLFMTALLRQQ
jgi:hypothetical protein